MILRLPMLFTHWLISVTVISLYTYCIGHPKNVLTSNCLYSEAQLISIAMQRLVPIAMSLQCCPIKCPDTKKLLYRKRNGSLQARASCQHLLNGLHMLTSRPPSHRLPAYRQMPLIPCKQMTCVCHQAAPQKTTASNIGAKETAEQKTAAQNILTCTQQQNIWLILYSSQRAAQKTRI